MSRFRLPASLLFFSASMSLLFPFPVWMPEAAAESAAQTHTEAGTKTGTKTEFRDYFGIELEGNASYYIFTLTPEVYLAGMTRNGRDLRVVDSDGNSVPYTFGGAVSSAEALETAEEIPEEIPEERPVLRPAPWFPLPRARDGKSVQDGFIIAADGTLRIRERPAEAEYRGGDIVDLSEGAGTIYGQGRPRLKALFVRIGPVTGSPDGTDEIGGYLGTVEILASDDLQYWRPVTTAQLLRLDHRGQRLERERIDFDGAPLDKPPRYLQLRWRGVPPVIASIEAEWLPPRNAAGGAENSPEKQKESRQWRENLPGRILPGGDVVFDTGGAFPADRLRFSLPRLNTVAAVKLYSRGNENDSWRLVRAETLYRLQASGGAEQETPEIRITPNRDRFWRMETESAARPPAGSGNKSGGKNGNETAGAAENAELGGAPMLSVGWRPETVTFLARGTPPFLLAVGNPLATDAGIPAAHLLVGDRPYLAAARIGAARPTPVTVQSAQPALPGAETLPLKEQTRRAILWGVLLAIIGLLAFMAWKAARHLPQEEDGKMSGGEK